MPVTSPVALSDLLASGYNSTVTITIGSAVYSITATELLMAAPPGTLPQAWLRGPLAGEWIVSGAPKLPVGTAHPHLNVAFHVRAYAGMKSVRTDVVMENDWAFRAEPAGIYI